MPKSIFNDKKLVLELVKLDTDIISLIGEKLKKDKKFNDKVSKFLRFMMDNFDTELVVMGIKMALTQYQLPIDPDAVKCFDEFHEKYGKYITAAQSTN